MSDLKMTIEGDLVVDPVTGDLDFVLGDDHIAQEVIFRLKTQKGDWILSPNIGCDLETFIGKPNIDLVHAGIESTVYKSLSFDGLILAPEINAVAVNENEVLILVEFPSVEDSLKTIQVTAKLDLRKGLVYSRIASITEG